MAMIWLAGLLRLGNGYQPRHRSPRRDAHEDEFDDGWPEASPGWYDSIPAWDGELAGQQDAATKSGQDAARKSGQDADAPGTAENDQAGDFLDQLTIGEIRRILEGCALNDPADVVPDLVSIIAHPSHTTDTLVRAWAEFEEATRSVFALQHRCSASSSGDLPGSAPDTDAATIMRLHADDAWRHLTRGQPAPASPAAVGAGR